MQKLFSRLPTKVDRLFMATVVIPTLIAILYFGLFAADVYISEARFVVRSPDKPTTSGLGVILKSAGFSNAGDEVFAAKDFITSRDALAKLNANGAVAKAYGNATVPLFDRYNAFGFSGSFEDLFRYFSKRVAINYDSSTSITTLTVRAFSARDAQRFNARLLEQAEGLVNRMNERGRQDLVTYAETEVREAQGEASRAGAALAAYRNQSGVIDPERQAQLQLQMVTKLQDELILAKSQLAQLETTVPDNPQVAILRTRIASLQRDIGQQTAAVAGGNRSLSAAAAGYQRRVFDRELADKRLAAALVAYQDARNEAREKQAYVERVVQPSLPDAPLEPRRIRGILATLVLGLIAYGTLGMLLAGVREHQV